MFVPIAYYLVLSAILFSIGIGSFLIKRNIITIFISIELMLNAVNLTFVAFAQMWHQIAGQVFVFYGFSFEILERQRNQITKLRVIPLKLESAEEGRETPSSSPEAAARTTTAADSR